MTPRLEAEAQALVCRYPRPAGALMPLVDLVLGERGACDGPAVRWIADQTGLPLAVVAGVASTRGDRDPTALRVCAGLSCRLMGAEEILERLRAAGVPGVVAAGCLGACAAAPVLARGDRLHDGLTAARLGALLADGS